jgi:hypothetical protein
MSIMAMSILTLPKVLGTMFSGGNTLKIKKLSGIDPVFCQFFLQLRFSCANTFYRCIHKGGYLPVVCLTYQQHQKDLFVGIEKFGSLLGEISI